MALVKTSLAQNVSSASNLRATVRKCRTPGGGGGRGYSTNVCFCSQKGHISVKDENNARTGNIQETVLDDDNAFLNVPEDYDNDEQCLRRSQDSGTVNSKG